MEVGVDTDERLIALVGFATHENYRFKQNPLAADEANKILRDATNNDTIERMQEAAEAEEESSSECISLLLLRLEIIN